MRFSRNLQVSQSQKGQRESSSLELSTDITRDRARSATPSFSTSCQVTAISSASAAIKPSCKVVESSVFVCLSGDVEKSRVQAVLWLGLKL